MPPSHDPKGPESLAHQPVEEAQIGEHSQRIRSWTITTSRDLLEKSKRDLQRFRQSHENGDGGQVDHAVNCAITLWHVHDWVWQENKGQLRARGIKNLSEFRNWLNERDGRGRLILCERIANGTKHLHLDKPSQLDLTTHVSAKDVPDRIDEAALRKLHEGETVVVHSIGIADARDVLKLTTSDGHSIRAYNLFEATAAFWEELLEEWQALKPTRL